jgi:pSer/pThr/pTyr-binding forkhead associated (FHA) protein
VPDSLLAILKVVFLGLLYLFFLRVLRAVWIELREPKTIQVAAVPPAPLPQPAPRSERRRRGGSKADRLVVLEPPERRAQSFELGDELTVGRAPGCGVALPEDTFVSQLHARVFRRDGGLYVEDLGSTNGTLLNNQPVTTSVPLRKGDRLQVGKTVLEVAR